MLTFYVLNVGHGSSIVVECNTKAGQRFGVIDSNARADEVPRALIKLRQLGASSLSFIALTHPHKDHFSGLYSIIRAFHGNIDQFYSCPFGDLLHNRSRLKSLAKGLKRIVRETDGMEERRAALELMQIIKWADEMASSGVLEWRECKGEEFSIAPEGFSPIDIATIQPPSRVIGDYVSRIMKEDMRVLGHFNDNEISLAFRFAFRDKVCRAGLTTFGRLAPHSGIRFVQNGATPLASSHSITSILGCEIPSAEVTPNRCPTGANNWQSTSGVQSYFDP
jgi:hypothetical protein